MFGCTVPKEEVEEQTLDEVTNQENTTTEE
jgi:hypothetical protein